MLKICRFLAKDEPRIGLFLPEGVADLSVKGIKSLTEVLENPSALRAINDANLPGHKHGTIELLAPVEQQEVWAAGVTYLRSKKARMEESEFSASALPLKRIAFF